MISNPAERVPIRWRSGGAPLSILAGSPVNCLVVDAPLDATAAKEAERLKLAVVPASDVKSVADAVWPRVPATNGEAGGAGPTGVPWVDSNGWRCLLARVKAPGETPWVMVPPPKNTSVRAEAYAVAIADAAAHGGRWVVDLDATTLEGLGKGSAAAMETWKTITRALAFFQRERAAAEFPPVANFGVVSDFAGENEFAAGEMLNLAARRPLSYTIVERTRATPQSIAGLKGVAWMDAQLPDAAMEKALREFVSGGGLLIAPSTAAKLAAGAKPAGEFEGRFALYSAGRGRIALAKEPWSDPYLLAADSHLLLSRKYDVVRAWNAGSCNIRFTANASKGAVQVVNYTGRHFGYPMSVYVARRYKTAVWSDVFGAGRQALTVTPKAEGVEVNLPPFPVYALVEYGA